MKGERCKWLDIFYLTQVTGRVRGRPVKYGTLFRGWVNRKGVDVFKEVERVRVEGSRQSFGFKCLPGYSFTQAEYAKQTGVQGFLIPENLMTMYAASRLKFGGGCLVYRKDGVLSMSNIELREK